MTAGAVADDVVASGANLFTKQLKGFKTVSGVHFFMASGGIENEPPIPIDLDNLNGTGLKKAIEQDGNWIDVSLHVLLSS
jgi:hypothetical protein